MNDEFLAEYLAQPGLQARFGNYDNYRNYRMQGEMASGVQTVDQDQTLKSTAKSIVQNKVADNVTKKTGLAKIAQFGMLPMAANILGAVLPADPYINAARGYFDQTYGTSTDSMGRIGEGDIMQGYGPISGGFLNMITGGKYGDPTTVGLDKAYTKRMNTIKEIGIPRLQKQGKDISNLLNRYNILAARQINDRVNLDLIKKDIEAGGSGNIKDIKKRISPKVNYTTKDDNRQNYQGGGGKPGPGDMDKGVGGQSMGPGGPGGPRRS
jgi:hypothetical protein